MPQDDRVKKLDAWNVAYCNLFTPLARDEREVRTYPRLRIPEFQRNFVWKEDQLREFVTSVKENDYGYYVGNIVIVDGEDGATGNIVDGQQRLITLSLICRVLADIVADSWPAKAKKMFCEEDNIALPRISFTRETLRTAYGSLMENEAFNPTDDSQRKLVDALHIISAIIGDVREFPDDESRHIFFEKVMALEFVVIACVTDSDAFQLFEGLNSTGLSLAPVELVKNAILGKIKQIAPGAMSSSVETWEKMESSFESENKAWFGKFLRHQWFSEGGYVNNPDLFKKIRESKIKGRTPLEIQGYLTQLNDDAALYLALRKANITSSEEIFPIGTPEITRTDVPKTTHYFKVLGLDQVYSLLLALLKYSKSEPLYVARNRIAIDFKKLLRFSIIAKFSKISPASYERIFSRTCHEITGMNYESFKVHMTAMFVELNLLLNEAVFIKSFSEKYENDAEHEGLTKFILSQLTDAPLDFSQLTLEHIVPQGNDWSQWNVLPENNKATRQSVEKIGNLSLLESSLNNGVHSSSFDDKIPVYASSVYEPIHSIDRDYGEDFRSGEQIRAIARRGSEVARIFFNSLI